MNKRFCQATENNRQPIIDELIKAFKDSKCVLEIGSGTGQHAVFFAPRLPHLIWHTSDLAGNHDSILAWLKDEPHANVVAPIALQIGQQGWPRDLPIDAVFSANTAHIMQPFETELMLQLVAENLPLGGCFCLYGPFNQDGRYTSEGNKNFDQHLLAQGCGGIRDINELQAWAMPMQLKNKIAMPANNFLLVWHKSDAIPC